MRAKFKIGDKVRIIDCPCKSKIGEIGRVIEVYPTGSKCECRVAVGIYWSCPLYESEIEPVMRVGEQLMLFEL